MSNNNQKRLTKKIAGILGLASISSLIGLPVFALTPSAMILAQQNDTDKPTTSTQECFVTPPRDGQLPEYCSQVVPAYENETNQGNNSDDRMNQETENMPSNSNMNENMENMPSNSNMNGNMENMPSNSNMNRNMENMPSNSKMNRQSYMPNSSGRITESERQSASFSVEDCFVTPTRDNSFPAMCSQVVPAYENEVSGRNTMMNRQASTYQENLMTNQIAENPSNSAEMNQETENSLEENNMTPEVEQIIENPSRVPGSSNTPENSNRSEDVNRSNMVSESDRMFMMKAAKNGMTEVQLGQMAVQKASSEAVREFGQRMVEHHSQANRELMQLAAEKGMTLPNDIGDENREVMSQLSQLSGVEFDRAYMEEMLRAHNKDLSMFQTQAQQGQDSDIKSWASQKVPTLETHLAMVRNRVEANRNNNIYR
ncbi:MAG TPA: DUF4142 domain-containing protein [Halomicronema sp.]